MPAGQSPLPADLALALSSKAPPAAVRTQARTSPAAEPRRPGMGKVLKK